MVDFISEVQEELRKDDYNKWLRRYGPYVLAGIVATIAAAGLWEWRKAQDEKQSSAMSAVFLDASQSAIDGDTAKSISQFVDISDKAPSGYAGLALLRAAQLEIDQNNNSAALTLLDKAANTFEAPRHAQLAQIKAAYILASEGRYTDVAARTTPLAEKGQPYEFLARELLGFAAQQNGNDSLAREQYSYLVNIPGVPDSIRERAKQYMGLIQVAEAETLDQSPPTPDEPITPETDNDE